MAVLMSHDTSCRDGKIHFCPQGRLLKAPHEVGVPPAQVTDPLY